MEEEKEGLIFDSIAVPSVIVEKQKVGRGRPALPLCECGHRKGQHRSNLKSKCTVSTCQCQQYYC